LFILFSCSTYYGEHRYLPNESPLTANNIDSAQIIVRRIKMDITSNSQTDDSHADNWYNIGIFIDGVYAGKIPGLSSNRLSEGYYLLPIEEGIHTIAAKFDMYYLHQDRISVWQGIETEPIEFIYDGTPLNFIVNYAGRDAKYGGNYLVNIAWDYDTEIQNILNLADYFTNIRNYTAALIQLSNVLKHDPNNLDAKNNRKVAWDRRIEENQDLYPAPFEGRWQFYRPASTIPARSEGYLEKVLDGYDRYERTFWQPSGGSGGAYVTETRQVPRYKYVERTRFIPAEIITERRIVYDFIDRNYILYNNGSQTSSGTFFYYDNNIELENGTILILSNDRMQSGSTNFSKQ
jgi:hypothetical protein